MQKSNSIITIIIFLICLLTSLVLEWWVRDCGFILTPDSRQYLSASASFKTSGVFICDDGTYYTNWPPLFPVLLSVFSNPQHATNWIYLFCDAVIALVVFYLANFFLEKTVFRVLFFAITFLGVHALLISVFLWSEMVFMMLLFVQVYLVINMKSKPVYFYLMLLVGFLLCLQRNAGLFWITGTCLWMITDNTSPRKKNIINSFICFAVCTFGLWIWNLYNAVYTPDDLPFYQRNFLGDAMLNTKMILSVLGKFLSPLRGVYAVFTGLGLVVLLVFYARKLFSDPYLRFLMISLVLYMLGFIVIPGLDIHDMERYFAVVSPIFVLLILRIIERETIHSSRKYYIAIVIILLWTSYSMGRTWVNARQWHGASCSGQKWPTPYKI